MTRSRGQGSIELLVVFFGFAALFLGLFELTMLYRTKHVLNTATFAAARAGALHNARVGPMDVELANGMVPLLVQSRRSADGLALARERALAVVSMPGVGIQIVSPTREAYREHRATQWSRLGNNEAYHWQELVPNDNLRLRPRVLVGIDSTPDAALITVQDANLLRVRSLWCHRLITPVLDRVIFNLLNLPLLITERQGVCSAISSLSGRGFASGFYVAASGDASMRMQSPAVESDLP